MAMFLGGLAWILSGGDARAENPPCAPCSLEHLARLSYCELEQLYRAAPPGAVPACYLRGRAIYCSDKPLTGPRSKLTHLLWHGKEFHCDGTLINQWCGFKAIRACVYPGTSWLDGGPSIIMDYRGMSHVWHDVRDELREVAPGLYLGAMYRCRGCQPQFVMFFALELGRCCD
jgi:hypothetical protein